MWENIPETQLSFLHQRASCVRGTSMFRLDESTSYGERAKIMATISQVPITLAVCSLEIAASERAKLLRATARRTDGRKHISRTYDDHLRLNRRTVALLIRVKPSVTESFVASRSLFVEPGRREIALWLCIRSLCAVYSSSALQLENRTTDSQIFGADNHGCVGGRAKRKVLRSSQPPESHMVSFSQSH